jgi:hypothetical protein
VEEPAEGGAAAGGRVAEEPAEVLAPPAPAKPVNKHSQSLIGRIRNRRKQRRAR